MSQFCSAPSKYILPPEYDVLFKSFASVPPFILIKASRAVQCNRNCLSSVISACSSEGKRVTSRLWLLSLKISKSAPTGLSQTAIIPYFPLCDSEKYRGLFPIYGFPFSVPAALRYGSQIIKGFLNFKKASSGVLEEPSCDFVPALG